MKDFSIYRKESSFSAVDRAKQLRKASGLGQCQEPLGFSEISGYSIGDVYISKLLKSVLYEALCSEIDACLERFECGDYGDISTEEREQNTDCKYFGDGERIVARYGISIGIILIEQYGTNTLLKLI